VLEVSEGESRTRKILKFETFCRQDAVEREKKREIGKIQRVRIGRERLLRNH
jgi:hypothetical protein